MLKTSPIWMKVVIPNQGVEFLTSERCYLLLKCFPTFVSLSKKYLITNDISHALSLLSLFKLLNLLEDRSNRIPTIYLKDVLFKNHKQKQILYRRVL